MASSTLIEVSGISKIDEFIKITAFRHDFIKNFEGNQWQVKNLEISHRKQGGIP
jgi:hypothetical protein